MFSLTNSAKTWDEIGRNGPRPPSAVALIIVRPHQATQPQLIVIRRSTRSGSHRGQIGFPGGRCEAGDRAPVDTAIREAKEEIGVDLTGATLCGFNGPFESIDGSKVFAVVFTIDGPTPLFKKNEHEVQAIHMIDSTFLGEENCRSFRFNMFGCWRQSFLFECGDIRIWGLSANILANTPVSKIITDHRLLSYQTRG